MDFNLLEQIVIRTISLTGISRLTELKETAFIKAFSDEEVHTAIVKLVDVGILTRKLILLGESMLDNFAVLELSETGKGVAESLTGEKPTPSQVDKLLEKHDNLEIAYLFEQCYPMLKRKGYLLEIVDGAYFITSEGVTYPILLDTYKAYSREEYLKAFDKMLENGTTFYYLSGSLLSSCFRIVEVVEDWLVTRNSDFPRLDKFRFKTSYLRRLIHGEGERWDTLELFCRK